MSDSLELGKLNFAPVSENPELVSKTVQEGLNSLSSEQLSKIYSVAIDPNLADTAQFCDYYNIGLDISANTIVVKAKRGDRKWYAMCNILATTKADINSVIRRHLGAKGVSFAPMDEAVEITAMEYGGIGPIGAPSDWPIIIDSRVKDCEWAIIGSGIRASKIALPGWLLGELPNAEFVEDAAIDI